ncbi:hypothetical protein CRUP_006725 [Coryphaenoides rupestris]|nr:hypothetical protein CRUP_006725 [Coryphaenoides rupestris]
MKITDQAYKNPQLHYYQGYHDIVVTFLLVLGERLATDLVEKLSTHHLRDFMDPTMDNTKHILNYLMPIIERVNPDVHDFMQHTAASTFTDFGLASAQQRPDSVLRRRRRQKQAALEITGAAGPNTVAVARPSVTRRFVRLAVMGLTVALGAAALAVMNTALEWAPKLDLFP